MTSFHKDFGIDSTYFDLLKTLDSVEIDSSELQFDTFFFKKYRSHVFSFGEDNSHGTVVFIDEKTGTTLTRMLYSKGKLVGISIDYWKNGNIKRESPYENDFLNGEQKIYNRKGILVKGKEFKNGILLETWFYRKPKKK